MIRPQQHKNRKCVMTETFVDTFLHSTYLHHAVIQDSAYGMAKYFYASLHLIRSNGNCDMHSANTRVFRLDWAFSQCDSERVFSRKSNEHIKPGPHTISSIHASWISSRPKVTYSSRKSIVFTKRNRTIFQIKHTHTIKHTKLTHMYVHVFFFRREMLTFQSSEINQSANIRWLGWIIVDGNSIRNVALSSVLLDAFICGLLKYTSLQWDEN